MALPLIEQIAIDTVAPPIGTCLWWLMSRGTAGALQKETISQKTKSRLNKGFWMVLAFTYALMFGATAYYNISR